MKAEVAVFLGERNETIAMDEVGVIQVFEKIEMDWHLKKTIPYSGFKTMSMGEIRVMISQIAEDLDPCRIVVAKKIIGLMYTILSPKGFRLWEIEGDVTTMLDEVLSHEVEASNTSLDATMPSPKQVNEAGCYSINLKEIIEIGGADYSSKQLLLPFLKTGKFYELEVICGHVPPWFEVELGKLGYAFEVIQKSTKYYSVTVTKSICAY